MRKTIKKIIAIALSVVVTAGMSVSLFAAGTSFTIEVTASRATSSFTYGNGGNLLEMYLTYVETGTEVPTTYSDTVYRYVNGSYTTVTATQNAHTGYTMSEATSLVKVGGVEYATINDKLD